MTIRFTHKTKQKQLQIIQSTAAGTTAAAATKTEYRVRKKLKCEKNYLIKCYI